MHRQLASSDIERAGAHARHSDKLDRNITKRVKGGEATHFIQESTEITESTADLNIQRYAAMIGKNLIKE